MNDGTTRRCIAVIVPGYRQCPNAAQVQQALACVHEHTGDDPICLSCARHIRASMDAGQFTCRVCLDCAEPHWCPVSIVRESPLDTGEDILVG